jgi:hypothetical protein
MLGALLWGNYAHTIHNTRFTAAGFVLFEVGAAVGFGIVAALITHFLPRGWDWRKWPGRE